MERERTAEPGSAIFIDLDMLMKKVPIFNKIVRGLDYYFQGHTVEMLQFPALYHSAVPDIVAERAAGGQPRTRFSNA